MPFVTECKCQPRIRLKRGMLQNTPIAIFCQGITTSSNHFITRASYCFYLVQLQGKPSPLNPVLQDPVLGDLDYCGGAVQDTTVKAKLPFAFNIGAKVSYHTYQRNQAQSCINKDLNVPEVWGWLNSWFCSSQFRLGFESITKLS